MRNIYVHCTIGWLTGRVGAGDDAFDNPFCQAMYAAIISWDLDIASLSDFRNSLGTMDRNVASGNSSVSRTHDALSDSKS
jgi:hypothetical protein